MRQLADRLADRLRRLRFEADISGELSRAVGLAVQARGLAAGVGDHCLIESEPEPGRTQAAFATPAATRREVRAEVIGFQDHDLLLMPFGDLTGIAPGARVRRLGGVAGMPAARALLGRVIDGRAAPLDGAGPIDDSVQIPVHAAPPSPLERRAIDTPLDTGVRVINALLTVGRGQRVGLMAGSGVGKSALLGMLCRNTRADYRVIALVGERGREVQDFVERKLEGVRDRSIVVAAPADHSPLLRLRAAEVAARIAEDLRDQGADVLLVMDSLTRYAQAQREIGLAAGEPPATRGYPPSVFAMLPRLVERAGATRQGSITAFYTVLAEGDDVQDPIVDSARAVLDGHIVLSRKLAERGHYPAIDIQGSVSRLFTDLAEDGQRAAALRFRQLYARFEADRDLVLLGGYQQGADPEFDEALARQPAFDAFLRQDLDDASDLDASRRALMLAVG